MNTRTQSERDPKNENEMRNVCEVDREMLCVTSYDTSILFISCHVSGIYGACLCIAEEVSVMIVLLIQHERDQFIDFLPLVYFRFHYKNK